MGGNSSRPRGTTQIDLLYQQILDEVKSPRGKNFLAADQIEALATYETVHRVLFEAKVPKSQEVAAYVVEKHAKRVFLSLVYCGRVQCMKALKDYSPQLCDDHLPVRLDDDHNLVTIDASESSQGDGRWPLDLNVRDRESMGAKMLFETAQWNFLSPIFTKEKFHYEFEPDVRLPFLKRSDVVKNGAFGSVREVELHHSHQEIVPRAPGQHLKVALKQINPHNFDWFLREMKILEGIQAIVHEIPNLHLISPIASYKIKKDDTGYLMFPWADRGNLKDFWAREENRDGVVCLKNPHIMMKWTLQQMQGLCRALVELHKDRPPRGGPSHKTTHCRHGDLKPENILVFHKESSDKLHIADLGLGKFHGKSTDDRKKEHEYTKTQTGTTRYTPPEFNVTKQISRLYDVWSLGCLFLEFIIWAAWGVKGLDRFIESNMVEFWEWNGNEVDVHYDVKKWIRNMSEVLRAHGQQTALGDLLEMVESDMLKVKDKRNRSENIHAQLTEIINKAEHNVDYCVSPTLPSRVKDHTLPITVPNRKRGDKEELGELEDVWLHHTDNEFARNLFKDFQDGVKVPDSQAWLSGPGTVQAPVFCSKCSGLNFWQRDFEIKDRVSTFADKSENCQLCKLIYESLEDMKLPENDVEIVIRRNGPVMEVHPGNRAILTLYTDPGSATPEDNLFQIGTPRLPVPGSREQFALFKTWLQVCDESHNHAMSNLAPPTKGKVDDRPTRVIDVGSLSNPYIRLLKGKDMESPIYLALSHRWGDDRKHHLGRTRSDNHDDRFVGIEWNELPLTFQDAITVARNLGVQYLWIDSICIIQDDDNDWKLESVRMEQVYSNAKCVLAASSANSSIEGFLKRSNHSPFITLRSSSGDIGYICRNVDNFQRDVDEATLNTRGWTLQERALARRTIHFTWTQAYFECGDGVRCESLMRLTNGRASLLADSNFPTSIEPRYKGGRVMLVQALYSQYSRRIFWDAQDRPIAISGLEKRLTSVFGTTGGYGVFEDFLGRSLLWKRDDDTQSLKSIFFPPERNVPTWSWMAYDGAIAYVEADFNRVDWTTDFSSPFDSASGARGKQHWEADGTNRPPIVGLSRIRELDLTKNSNELFSAITLDIPGREKQAEDLRCVVVGKTKPGEEMGPFILSCYVLIVRLSSDKTLRGVYLRVGAGILLENQICWNRHEAGNLH